MGNVVCTGPLRAAAAQLTAGPGAVRSQAAGAGGRSHQGQPQHPGHDQHGSGTRQRPTFIDDSQ